jgi:hypothetical protein
MAKGFFIKGAWNNIKNKAFIDEELVYDREIQRRE